MTVRRGRAAGNGGHNRTRRVVVIAAAPRTGSTLLSRVLMETGRVGEPREYLNPGLLARDMHGLGTVSLTLRGHAGRVRRRLRGGRGWTHASAAQTNVWNSENAPGPGRLVYDAVQIRRQSDALNEEWRQRFLAESALGDLGRGPGAPPSAVP